MAAWVLLVPTLVALPALVPFFFFFFFGLVEFEAFGTSGAFGSGFGTWRRSSVLTSVAALVALVGAGVAAGLVALVVLAVVLAADLVALEA